MKVTVSVLWIIILLAGLLGSCKKQKALLSKDANDLFWITNKGADMPVWVKGNTTSGVVILVVHGGPGEGAYDFSDNETARLRERFSVAYWDQRDAGAAAGNSNYEGLSLSLMKEDLKQVINVLKFRYNNASIFLYAHSFGGLLAADFLVSDTNQNTVNGWIDLDGAHNYPLCNSLSRQMLIDTGMVQINQNNHASQWTSIVNFCRANDPGQSLSVSNQVEAYAHEAESYMGVSPPSATASLFSPEDPTSLLSNWIKMYYTAAGDNFIESLQSISFSDQLYKVRIPTLLLWGQYDFTVPAGVANDALTHLGSNYKKLVFFPHSGHRPMAEDTDAVEDEIIRFINQFK